MKPKVILLDWDGTIVDGFPQICQAMNQTLVHFEKEPWDDATLATQVPRPDKVKFPEIFAEQSGEALKYFYHAIDEISAKIDEPKLIPGAQEFMKYMQELRQKGVYVGIVSNSRHASIERELAQLGWSDAVDVMVASDDVKNKKPNEESYREAIKNYTGRSMLLARDTLYIGDANTDRDFAENSGMQFLGFGNKFDPPLAPEQQMDGLLHIVKRLKTAERPQEIGRT
jgi:HAD superfamily hydrolase (TIGR01549 family)